MKQKQVSYRTGSDSAHIKNPSIYNILRWVTEQPIVDQESDVSSIIFLKT